MRARRRRSVLNTISAAALEVAIMGIFVIIAQPQLRDALFEILQVDPAHGHVQAASQPAANISSREASPASLDRAVQSVMNSPVGQAVENSFAKWTTNHQADTNVPSLSAQTLSAQTPTQLPSQPLTAPPLLPSTTTLSAGTTSRNQPVQNHLTGYSPYEQFESFRVSVPPSNSQPALVQQPMAQQPIAQQPLVQQPLVQPRNSLFGNGAFPSQTTYNNQSTHTSTPQYAIPHYVPPQSYGGYQSYGAQNQMPTQLTANQWNIASAAQSHYPNTNVQPGSNSWIPTHATETSFRQVAPPYGTQGMWK